MFTSQIYVSVTAELPVSGGWWIYIMSNSQSLPSPSVSFHIKHSSLCWIPRMVAIWLYSNYSWILGSVSLRCRMVSCLWPGGSQYDISSQPPLHPPPLSPFLLSSFLDTYPLEIVVCIIRFSQSHTDPSPTQSSRIHVTDFFGYFGYRPYWKVLETFLVKILDCSEYDQSLQYVYEVVKEEIIKQSNKAKRILIPETPSTHQKCPCWLCWSSWWWLDAYCYLVCLFIYLVWDRVSLHNPDWPRALKVDFAHLGSFWVFLPPCWQLLPFLWGPGGFFHLPQALFSQCYP